MAELIKMPKMSDTMTEGVIAAWLVKVGDKVKSGDILAEVETDKATMELENYEDGTLLYIGAEAGQAARVDSVIAIVGEAGEAFEHLLNGDSAPAAQSAPQAEEEVLEEEETVSGVEVNATVVRMPKMSDTMTEGVISAWLKKVGDKVKAGDTLAEVETDKATMELENYEDGTLLYIGVEAGASIAVDGIIAIVGEAGTDYSSLLSGSGKKTSAKKQPSADASGNGKNLIEKKQPLADEAQPGSNHHTGGRMKASPLAKKIAKGLGYDIAGIAGSGEGGRVVKRDVENFVPSAKPAKAAPAKQEVVAPAKQETAAPAKQETAPKAKAITTLTPADSSYGGESYDEINVSQMRKTIARRLAESKFTAPHFYLTMSIDMDKAVEVRKSLNDISPVKISFNDMVIRAVAGALRMHPKVNTSWLGDKIRFNHHIHIGVAMAVDEGLVVPVIRFADTKTLSRIATEVKDFGARAKSKQLQPQDWEGNTFTISNLGMFGIEQFTAIVNPPDACILAVGGIQQIPVVKNGQVVPGNVMKITLSCDHRVVDGAVGSAFLQTLKGLLEDPMRMLI